MKVSIFGTGYVGLVTGACLASAGHHVLCADINEKKIAQLKQGVCPIYEENLQPLLEMNLANEQIQFTTDSTMAVLFSEIIIIAVGTPSRDDGSANTDYVMQVAEQIGSQLSHKAYIMVKSTVPVGTGRQVRDKINQLLAKRNLSFSIDVISNPEFLQEGSAIQNFIKPDRIIIGAISQEAFEIAHALYMPVIKNCDLDVPIIEMSNESAELTKYAANAFLATKVSFINEISQIAERCGADINDIKAGIGTDPRINPRFLNAGCGYGGSCFPKDVLALMDIAQKNQYEPHLLAATLKRNEVQKHLLFEKINHYFYNNLHGKIIALWGLSFKPNTDDIRSAPSRSLMESLWQAGAIVQAYDPMAMNNIRQRYPSEPKLILAENPASALHKADALVIVTEWDIFQMQSPDLILTHLKNPVIFDGRNIFDSELMKQKNIKYFGVGHGESIHAANTSQTSEQEQTQETHS